MKVTLIPSLALASLFLLGLVLGRGLLVLFLLLEERGRPKSGTLLLLFLGRERGIGISGPRGVALALGKRVISVRLITVVGSIT